MPLGKCSLLQLAKTLSSHLVTLVLKYHIMEQLEKAFGRFGEVKTFPEMKWR